MQRTADVLRPLYETMRTITPTPTTDASRREWLRDVLASDTDTTRAARLRGEKLLSIWRDAGIWVHPKGDLERALGMDKKSDSREYARRAAHATEFDETVRWALFRFDRATSARVMLEVEIERIAQDIQRFIRLNPSYIALGPVGPFAEADSNLVAVHSLTSDRYLITVKAPSEFAGWTLEFDRSTAPDEMRLQEPE